MYTDGASTGNPGPGGYGTVLMSGKHYKELSGGFQKTTNNRMELLAVIVGLESLKQPGCDVTIYSDSKYVVDAVEKKWVFEWHRKGFKGKKNPDLWLRYLEIASLHKIKFIWVKGHAGNHYNEICDQLAVKAAQQKNLPADVGYMDSLTNDEAGLF
jgi:ribonuclease HI